MKENIVEFWVNSDSKLSQILTEIESEFTFGKITALRIAA